MPNQSNRKDSFYPWFFKVNNLGEAYMLRWDLNFGKINKGFFLCKITSFVEFLLQI